jgi:hypothetical protein
MAETYPAPKPYRSWKSSEHKLNEDWGKHTVCFQAFGCTCPCDVCQRRTVGNKKVAFTNG